MRTIKTHRLVIVGLVFGLGAVSAHASSLEEGLIAWWRMELKVGSTIPDASGKGHDLTVNGTPTFDDNIVIFNDDGTLEAADSDALDLMGDWTVSYWVREDSHDHSPNSNTTNGMMCKIRSYHDAEGGWFLNSDDGNNVHASIYGTGDVGPGNCVDKTPEGLVLGTWYRLTTTYDASTHTVRIYFDDQLKYENEGTCPLRANVYPVVIGGFLEYNLTRVPYCRGAMSDIRIYDRTLSDSDVGELFAMGSPEDACDDFEDGVIDAALWEWGGLNRATSGGQGGSWQWSHEELIDPDDGYLSMHVWGPGSGNTFGAEAWVRTVYDYNDGANHVIDFTWEADVQDFHYNRYFIQVTDGYISSDGNIHWSQEPPIPGTTNLLWHLDGNGDEVPGGIYPASEFNPDWSMSIDSSGVVQLYDDSGSLMREESLDDSYPWYVRFMVVDATSSGFPAGDITLNLYEFCTDDDGEPDEADSDGDGVLNEDDDCPESDLDATIVIAECESGVENEMLDDGCTMADLIMQCADDAVNHGAFVRCVSHLANLWKCQKLINGQQKGAIMSCAGQANLP